MDLGNYLTLRRGGSVAHSQATVYQVLVSKVTVMVYCDGHGQLTGCHLAGEDTLGHLSLNEAW